MTDYTKLVEALRETATFTKFDDLLSKREQKLESLAFDAADAIEDLQAQLPKRGEWIETEEEEWGIYPFKKQTCSVCDCKIDHTFMLACMDYFDDRDTVFHYCPNCGAKMMEVQE